MQRWDLIKACQLIDRHGTTETVTEFARIHVNMRSRNKSSLVQKIDRTRVKGASVTLIFMHFLRCSKNDESLVLDIGGGGVRGGGQYCD